MKYYHESRNEKEKRIQKSALSCTELCVSLQCCAVRYYTVLYCNVPIISESSTSQPIFSPARSKDERMKGIRGISTSRLN